MNRAVTTDALSDLKNTVRRHPGLAQVGAALAMYEGGRNAFATAREWYKRSFTYTVAVRESDRIYDAVMDWLMDLLPATNHRQLLASSSTGTSLQEPVDPSQRPHSRLRVQYAEDSDLTVDVDGHRVRVTLQAAAEESSEERRRPDRRIEFRCRTAAAQAAVLAHLNDIHDTQTKTAPTLWMTGMWGDWQKRSDLPPRTLDSVILPAAQKTAIVDDLAGFLAAEDRYSDLAIPWHRGYLFHGPPGTGKTSLAKALATEFGLDLWYISLADLRETSDLLQLIRGVRPRSVLLLEDIDTARVTHDRGTSTDKPADGTVSMGALLNALDGVATPHGLITIMTTNHLEKLDPALTRAGRMDRLELVDRPTIEEADALYARFYREPLALDFPAGHHLPLSQAELSETFKRHLDDPHAGRQALAHVLGKTEDGCGLEFGDGYACDLPTGHA